MLFQNTFEYTYCRFPNDTKTFTQSIQASINDFVAQIVNMQKETNITIDFVNKSYILNFIKNNKAIYTVFDEVLNLFVDFFKDNDNNLIKLSSILMLTGIFFIIVSFIMALTIQIIWIRRTKDETYKALTSLPKNTVSALVENLRVLKTDGNNESTTNTDTEVNKQEDNILKILVTGGDSSGNVLTDRTFLIVGTLVTIICEIVSIYLFVSLYKYESNRLVVSAPHLSYLSSVYIKAISSYFNLRILSVQYENDPAQITVFPIETMEELFDQRIELLRSYYHKARFGGGGANESPFAGFQEGVDNADKIILCKDETAVVVNFLDLASCRCRKCFHFV